MSNSFFSRRRFTSGFSLTELLTVMAVISILLAISLPALSSVRDNARTTACASNIRQIGLGLNTYEKEFRTFPPGASGGWLWPVFVLPQLEQLALYKKIDLKKDPISQASDGGPLSSVVPFFICPSASQTEPTRAPDNRIAGDSNIAAGCMDYVGMAGPGTDVQVYGTNTFYPPFQGVLVPTTGAPKTGPQDGTPRVSLKMIRDGLGKTILISECTGRAERLPPLGTTKTNHGAWGFADQGSLIVTMRDRAINTITDNDLRSGIPAWGAAWINDQLFSEHRAGGVNTVYCDMSMRFLRDTIDPQMLAALASRSSAERLQLTPDGNCIWDPNQP